MALCKSCSAPLLANTNVCQYCGVRNDVDLHVKHPYTVAQSNSDRICPHCETPLQTVKIRLDRELYIERCEHCFGLFFDLQELEVFLEHSVSHITAINRAHLDNINIDRYARQLARYIKCPVCQKFMRRTNYAHKSGVIVDSCRLHGLWLDSGEVTHLMEWKKVGGQLLHGLEQRKKLLHAKKKQQADRLESLSQYPKYKETNDLETDLLGLLLKIVRTRL